MECLSRQGSENIAHWWFSCSLCVFVFVIAFVFVFVFVFVFPIRFWIAIIISFQKMYGLGGLMQVEVVKRRRRAKWLEEKEKEKKEEEKTKDRSVPDGSDKKLCLNF